jgi:hypothetical protein
MVVVFRIENQKRKERETQEPDENSKSTLECLSSWCQVLKEWRRCSSYGNPWGGRVLLPGGGGGIRTSKSLGGGSRPPPGFLLSLGGGGAQPPK